MANPPFKFSCFTKILKFDQILMSHTSNVHIPLVFHPENSANNAGHGRRRRSDSALPNCTSRRRPMCALAAPFNSIAAVSAWWCGWCGEKHGRKKKHQKWQKYIWSNLKKHHHFISKIGLFGMRILDDLMIIYSTSNRSIMGMIMVEFGW